jgi:hypothetical protein
MNKTAEKEKIPFTQWSGFHRNPKQKLAHEVAKIYDILLYGGAMGGGKSYWLRREVMYWVAKFSLELGKPVMGALFCEDYGSLQDRQISKIVEEFPSSIGIYKASDKVYGRCFMLSKKLGGGVIVLRNLDDPGKYDSSEFAVIGIDQAEKDPFATFKILLRRNRWPGFEEKGLRCKMFLTANPGGEVWLEQLFIDRNFPPELREMSDKFYFIQALPKDNPALGEDYWMKLRSMPPIERRAYEEGDWKAFAQEMDSQGYLKLLTPKELQNAFVDTIVNSGVPVLGVDPAAGGDESAIVKRTDTLQQIIFNQKLQDTMMLVSLVIDAIRKHKAKIVVIDATGVGLGVYQRLKELKQANRWAIDIYGVSFGNRPKDPVRFADLKAELFWNQRTWILGGGKLLRDDGFNEFNIIKYKKNSDMKIVMQSKEEMRKLKIPSPNVADACALTQYIPVKSLHNSRFVKSARGRFYDQTEDLWKG